MDTNLKREALEQAVIAAMAEAARSEMRWGIDDCGLWFANIVRDVLGYDPAVKFRGHYRTRIGALRALGKKGLLGQIRATAKYHGWVRIKPLAAQPGDIGMAWVNVGGRPVLATVVCRASGWFVGRGEVGWTALPADQAALAWSVL